MMMFFVKMSEDDDVFVKMSEDDDVFVSGFCGTLPRHFKPPPPRMKKTA